MDVSIATLPPRRIVRLRHVGPYEDCRSAWDALMELAGRANLHGPDTWYAGMAWDNPDEVPAAELRYDACISCPAGFTAESPFEVVDFAGGEYAMVVHRGPYEGIPNAYDHVYHEWFPKSGRAPREDACVEVYRNSPAHTAPADLETEIWMPLAE